MDVDVVAPLCSAATSSQSDQDEKAQPRTRRSVVDQTEIESKPQRRKRKSVLSDESTVSAEEIDVQNEDAKEKSGNYELVYSTLFHTCPVLDHTVLG